MVAHTRGELAGALETLRANHKRIALVPTMGALHEGHRSLTELALHHADAVVVSIFVNPLQFAPTEDLACYPRPFDADLALCAAAGVALVFAPTEVEMYPSGRPSVTIEAGPMGEVLEGVIRPGHYDGVLTVVAKLFGLIGPAVAVFGAKDAQQLALIRRMVADLELPVEIVSGPTIRSGDGLALSSRNQYLDTLQSQQALVLSRALRAAQTFAQAAGARSASGVVSADVLAVALEVLAQEPALVLDYCVLVEPGTFAFISAQRVLSPKVPARLLIAGRLGSTRLLDNALIFPPAEGAQT